MYYGMDEHNLTQGEGENIPTVNKEDHIYHFAQTWSMRAQLFYASHLCWISLSVV